MNISVKILTGYRCNQCCVYCDELKTDKKDFYHLQEAAEIINTYKNYPNFYLSLDGGECLLYPNLIRWALQFNCKTYLFSNGTLLTPELIQSFHKKVIMRISLDGIEFVHNYYRKQRDGSNSFQKTVNGIKLLQEYEIPFIIGATITDISLPFLLESITFLESLQSEKIILTAQMFQDEENIYRKKTAFLYEQAKQILQEQNFPNVFLNGFHETPEKQDQSLEILFKDNRIELNIAGYKTPILQTFAYNEIEQLKEAVKLQCN